MFKINRSSASSRTSHEDHTSNGERDLLLHAGSSSATPPAADSAGDDDSDDEAAPPCEDFVLDLLSARGVIRQAADSARGIDSGPRMPCAGLASRAACLGAALCGFVGFIPIYRSMTPDQSAFGRSVGLRAGGHNGMVMDTAGDSPSGGAVSGGASGVQGEFVTAVLGDALVDLDIATEAAASPSRKMGRWQQLRYGEKTCLVASEYGSSAVSALGCDASNELQQWSYDHDTGLVRNLHGRCLELAHINKDGSPILMAPCSPLRMQNWFWDSMGMLRIKQKWNDVDGRLRVQISNWCLVADGEQALMRQCISDSSKALAQRWLPGDTPLPPKGCGNKRFLTPVTPAKATGHNGIRVTDACFGWQGPNKSAHVFVIGDWGGEWTPQGPKPADHRARRFGVRWRPFATGIDDHAQLLVAHQMALRAPQTKPDYILNVGDNFYWSGIGDPKSYGNGMVSAITCSTNQYWLQGPPSQQWSTLWDKVYTGPYLAGLQWLGVLGNHDYGGFVFTSDWHQSIGFTWMSGGRWLTPAQYWRAKAWYPDFSIDYYFVDSNFVDALPPDVDPEHNMCSRMHNEPGASCPSTGPENVDACNGWFTSLWADQVKWLETNLHNSAAEWQVVVTHFPPSFAQDVWAALSRKYGIDLIIVGHAHFQSVTYDPHGPFGLTGVIISGGGGGITSEAPPATDGNDDQYGFVDLSLGREEIVVESISHGGKVRSTTHVRQRMPDRGAPSPVVPQPAPR